MSESEAVAAAQRMGSLLVRSAEPADHEAIRGVVLGAHAQHADQLAPEVFSRYLADQLDLGTHASYGRLLVAEAGDGVRGFAAFYPDASVQDSGFPSGWAAVRVLAVHPGADGPGVARALLGACERLAAQAGVPVLASARVNIRPGRVVLSATTHDTRKTTPCQSLKPTRTLVR